MPRDQPSADLTAERGALLAAFESSKATQMPSHSTFRHTGNAPHMPPSVLSLAADGLSAQPRLQDGNVVWFKMMNHTKLKQLVEAYCARQSLEMDLARFLFEGNRLRDSQPPDGLEREDEVIHVFVIRVM
jgi:hypothetical protein